MGNKLTTPILGQDKTRYPLGDSSATRHTLLMMCEQAHHVIRIASSALSPSIFDNEALGNALSRLARANRLSEVRILLAHSKALAERRHHLLQLSHRLPSSVAIRKIDLREDERMAEYVLVDDRGVIIFGNSEQEPGSACFHDRSRNKTLASAFDLLWQRSETPVELRRLLI